MSILFVIIALYHLNEDKRPLTRLFIPFPRFSTVLYDQALIFLDAFPFSNRLPTQLKGPESDSQWECFTLFFYLSFFDEDEENEITSRLLEAYCFGSNE